MYRAVGKGILASGENGMERERKWKRECLALPPDALFHLCPHDFWECLAFRKFIHQFIQIADLLH